MDITALGYPAGDSPSQYKNGHEALEGDSKRDISSRTGYSMLANKVVVGRGSW